MALAHQLKTQERPIQASGELVWIDLVFSRDSEALNFEVDGKQVTLRRWYPDPLTLGVIGCYLKERGISAPRKGGINPTQIWNQVKSYAKSIYHEKGSRLFEIATFCRAAIVVAELSPGVRLPQALVEYAIGRIPSSSIPPENQRDLFHLEAFPGISCSITDFKIPAGIGGGKKQARQKLDCNFEKLISSIKQALRLKISHGEKNTREKAAKKLQKVLEEELLPAPAYLLVDWLHTLLYLEKNTVSTAMRYFSAVGKSWLSATVSVEFEDFDESDFEELYLGILDAEMSEKSRRYNAARLKQLHVHGISTLGFSPLTGDLDVRLSKSQSTVRAAYLSEQQFNGLRESVEHMDGLDELTRQGLVCLLTISFRVGLRRGELLKLRVCDVEKSGNRWIFIRNNRFGDNKSSSALRKFHWLFFLLKMKKNILIRIFLVVKHTVELKEIRCFLVCR
ncbi:phage integrase family protein [gamma proteobacterium IMCC2047]|nr:phage integrase family protein [gamma proteobacterium IMCC2047]